jgi:membrane-bound lytic murein transglycosylase B
LRGQIGQGDRGSTVVKVLRYRCSVGTAIAQWLRFSTTNQKVAGSIPDGVMEFFIDINPSDRTMALGSTQPLTEMSTRSISWG